MRIIKAVIRFFAREMPEDQDDDYGEGYYHPGAYINDGIRLKMIREALGWTPKELAEFWECSEDQIRDHEYGDLGIRLWRIRKLFQACNINVSPSNQDEDPNHIAPLLAKIEKHRSLGTSNKGTNQ